MQIFHKDKEHQLKISIVLFWAIFWLLNVVDKIIGGETYLWVGTDSLAEFTHLFNEIGVESVIIPKLFLLFTSLVEVLVMAFVFVALWLLVSNKVKEASEMFLKGIIIAMLLFTFFSIGDQIFGERSELLEHTMYWLVSLVSWFIYSHKK